MGVGTQAHVGKGTVATGKASVSVVLPCSPKVRGSPLKL